MSLATPASVPQPAVAVPTVTPSACAVYAWCAETDDHYDHVGAETRIPSPKHDEPDYLTAHLLHLSGSRPIIGLEGASLDAEQARQEARNLRAFAEQLESLATVLDATRITVDGAL